MGPLLIVTLLFAQVEEKKILRISKDVYLQAVRDLNRANDLIADDHQAATERVTGILGNSKLRYFECRLLIEVQPQIFEPHDFFPYQVRGRARLTWGKKASLEDSLAPLKGAIEDLKLSADKKVPGSAEMLKEAEAVLAQKKLDIEKKRAGENDPVTKFKGKYDNFLNDDKYRSALNYVTNSPEGQKLTEEQRQGYAAEVEQKCAEFRDSKIAKFRNQLNETSVSELMAMDEREFNRDVAQLVPPDTELTDKAIENPSLAWIRRHVKTLKSIQARQGKIDGVLAAATEALKLDPPDFEGENVFFKGMAFLGSELCQRTITANTTNAETARKDARAKLQTEADKVFAQWKAFGDGLDPKVLKRHPDIETSTKNLGDSVKEFPKELADLDAVKIEDCFKDPGTEFKKVEDNLLNLVANLGTMGRVAIESKQELYTKLITAGTLRRLFEGMPEEEVAREFLDIKPALIKVGGPTDPDKFGPRVKKVFDKLKT